ncbi:hypothetical protein AJ80_03665 [Polytolypa hystricis UAMH7299]|uniref:Transcription factor domain-containing protein n=1 Tax=Polytolypa hystricis (strain UAMH7299) TaxID=1447883 RepID=A0A2B7YHK5_POLH7|nr:hypothetical protein AJ80_03665 [Polytolypa hystricis UAMH7299]
MHERTSQSSNLDTSDISRSSPTSSHSQAASISQLPNAINRPFEVDTDVNDTSTSALMLMEGCPAFATDAESLTLDFGAELQGQHPQNHVLPLANEHISTSHFGYANHPSDCSLTDDTLGDILNGQPLPDDVDSMTIQSSWRDMARPDKSSTENTQWERDCCCNPPCTSTLPWVATWCRRDLDKMTLTKLIDSKAYSIPSSETIDWHLKYFFQFKHSLLPVVNEWEIYCLLHSQPIADTEMVRPISLALFYAIMFSGSTMATKEEAAEAGFATVLAMRRTFYTRAKILYEAGCETGSMQKVQICLLLSTSTRPTFENGVIPREHWLLEAQHILNVANVPYLLSQTSLPPRQLSRWKLLYSCCIQRVLAFLLGSQRVNVASSIALEIPSISLRDLYEELKVPWYLSVEAKRKLASLFLAKIDLFRHITLICNIIIRHSGQHVTSMVSSLPRPYKRSIMGELEECEGAVSDWRVQYDYYFQDVSDNSNPPDRSELPWITQRSFLKLTYEFVISTLHQIGITFGSSKVTPWASKLKEASHQALLESAKATTTIVGQLISWDALRYLPSAAVKCIFVPFTINGLAMKASISAHGPTVYGMSTCLKALEDLSERYDDVDFFLQLHRVTLSLVHQSILQEGLRLEHNKLVDSTQLPIPVTHDTGEMFSLGQTDAYSQVLKLHARILSTGKPELV